MKGQYLSDEAELACVAQRLSDASFINYTFPKPCGPGLSGATLGTQGPRRSGTFDPPPGTPGLVGRRQRGPVPTPERDGHDWRSPRHPRGPCWWLPRIGDI